jgi:hypothetical protein
VLREEIKRYGKGGKATQTHFTYTSDLFAWLNVIPLEKVYDFLFSRIF